MSLTPIGEPQPIGDEYGFASSRVQIVVRTAGGEECPVVVKAWDATSQGYDEIDFYEHWAASLPVRLPRLVAAHATEALGALALGSAHNWAPG